MKENSSNNGGLLTFVVKECIHAFFVIGIPLIISLLANNAKKKSGNEETFEEIKDDFETGHKW